MRIPIVGRSIESCEPVFDRGFHVGMRFVFATDVPRKSIALSLREDHSAARILISEQSASVGET